jgi:hypothetical protein
MGLSIASVALGKELAKSLVSSIGTESSTAAIVARTLCLGARTVDLVTFRGCSPSGLKKVLDDFSWRGWLVEEGTGWRVQANLIPMDLPGFFEGVATVRNMIGDHVPAYAAVTMPRPPSRIGIALPTMGLSHAQLVNTEIAMQRVASAAVTRLVVMTPFTNSDGLRFVQVLFKSTEASERVLVVRYAAETRLAIQADMAILKGLGISIKNYMIEDDDGFETFHAKVVLADEHMAYVGSANMLKYARHSVELGVVVQGVAARVIANVVRAAEAVALQIEH